ncbi:hypothetical protein CABS01_13655 [Colletotrichum abscissum]|uniref:Uncharacterized protein n=1 Tax=Colletotrichum abscissum TaxID=1671311 RepID=A0A9P9XSW7_9PEZI|nr:uncharacterized protein CABS01_13655 [Colletotrichum abscissum]KAI3559033.1 hypothetical protein CABS02_00008 [Colletotrichum abscissum]KAK1484898.1 hypothetical protein CABS01_13655 [Colletotrichum abscissum]
MHVVCKPRYASDDGMDCRLTTEDGTCTLCQLPIIGSICVHELTLRYFASEFELRRGDFMLLDIITTGAGNNPITRHCRFQISVHMDPGGRNLKINANFDWKPYNLGSLSHWPPITDIVRYLDDESAIRIAE